MNCKNGAEHLASLRDGRAVFIDGTRIDDVTTHPSFRNAVRSAAALYDFQARPREYRGADLRTFDRPPARISFSMIALVPSILARAR